MNCEKIGLKLESFRLSWKFQHQLPNFQLQSTLLSSIRFFKRKWTFPDSMFTFQPQLTVPTAAYFSNYPFQLHVTFQNFTKVRSWCIFAMLNRNKNLRKFEWFIELEIFKISGHFSPIYRERYDRKDKCCRNSRRILAARGRTLHFVGHGWCF